jgi:hypothetical protein
MKFASLAASISLASIFIMSSSFAFAQTPGSNTPEKPGIAAKHHSSTSTIGRSQSTGSAVTSGSNVPQDKPNLSSSPESSDTSQKAK